MLPSIVLIPDFFSYDFSHHGVMNLLQIPWQKDETHRSPTPNNKIAAIAHFQSWPFKGQEKISSAICPSNPWLVRLGHLVSDPTEEKNIKQFQWVVGLKVW